MITILPGSDAGGGGGLSTRPNIPFEIWKKIVRRLKQIFLVDCSWKQ